MNRVLASLFAFAVLTGGCAVSSEHDDEGSVDADEAAASTTPSFYAVRQDYRRCMYPMCGGVWYRKLNNAETRCLDGGKAAECYAANFDTSAIKGVVDPSTPILYLATVKAERINVGRWARLVATEAWKSLTAFEPKESIGADPRFYSVKDNGIRCITTPCFSLDAKRVNLSAKLTLSGLDLTGIAGATTEQLDAATVGLEHGIVVFGSVKGTLTVGRSITATQAYVKVVADPKACTDDSQCGYVMYPTAVTSSSECYCPTCPQPGNVSTDSANRASWEKFCSGLKCPLPPCAPPPPVACVAGSCAYSFSDL
jgi:hypothetical protein